MYNSNSGVKNLQKEQNDTEIEEFKIKKIQSMISDFSENLIKKK